jgi:phosphatidylglycerophosphatase A
MTRMTIEPTVTESRPTSSPAAPVPAKPAKRTLWAYAVATVAGIGYLRPGPGTWSSAVTVLLWWLLARALPPGWLIPAAIVWAIAATAIGIPAATRVERESGKHDPSHVVIDEMAGQMVALIGAPLGWKSLLAGFILFRVFDIVKPPPVRQLERLPEGAGIVIDDLGAGLYALIVLQLLLWLGWLA